MKKGNENMSAVAHHVLETGHAIHWKAKVLRKETETVKRKVHEALLINKLQKREGCKMNLHPNGAEQHLARGDGATKHSHLNVETKQ